MRRRLFVEVTLKTPDGDTLGKAVRVVAVDVDLLNGIPGPMNDLAQDFFVKQVGGLGVEAYWHAFPRQPQYRAKS